MSTLIYSVSYTCSNCNKEHKRSITDTTGYYENTLLSQGDDPSFRCRICKNVKPVEHFDHVNKKRSDRRRKMCRDCRNPIVAQKAREKRANAREDNNLLRILKEKEKRANTRED